MPKSRCAGGRRRHVAAGDLDAAGILHLEAGDHAQQRGLAAARRAEEADELARLHLERDVVERAEGAEALGNARRRAGGWRAVAGRWSLVHTPASFLANAHRSPIAGSG